MDLNQVTLPAIDIELSSDFYKRLGLIQIVRSPHYARFICPNGNSTFSIHLTKDPIVNDDFVVYFECNDLDEKVDQLNSDGLIFDQLPKDEVWLWREARLKDPTGNMICLYFAGDNRKDPPWKITT